ncbi:DUF1735 domain-containing protein [Parabacteroides sp. 52]|uniref:BT_3987 domain-containing protein n=1 Tax=unclassified Parabacteroides TaxID=2649774 RepID=UPI0013D24915|nr:MULTISPECIES: DUF1735 domain-containing protein [unclassified Parabacteroides]MDH6535109.1 hypothetical protein [Parabacteroides sp. PM5-20]NDV55491.1 DUF1735 domain-containing protein [Parabacteroides sp. 52]
MKKIGLLSLLFACGVSFIACDDNKDEFLSDYNTILYFKESGEHPLTLYKTGEDMAYPVTVNKAGSDLANTTSVGINVLDDAALSTYNATYNTDYARLPENCYEIQENKLNFNADDLYKLVNVVFKTDLIYQLSSDKKYVLPIALSESKDSINQKKSYTLLIPTVLIPTVYFNQTGFVSNTFADGGAEQATFKLPIALPMKNKWTFDCKVGMDASLLDAYNKEQETDYALLPENAYTLSGNGVVPFTTEYSQKDLEIMVDRTKLVYGNYVLPLRLTDCTQQGFVIDPEKDACLYGISYVPDKSKLKSVALKADMLSSNAVEPSEGSLANLLDGNVETFFHSAWSVAVDGNHYLQVALPTESTALSFNYTTRSANGNAAPVEIIIEGSMDGVSFSKINTLDSGLPTEGKQSYVSQVMVGKPFKIVRFTVTKNKTGGKFFVWSEFGMKIF